MQNPPKNQPRQPGQDLTDLIGREERNARRRAAKKRHPFASEDKEQIAFVAWARPRCDLVWHTPNARQYSRRSWAYWKAMGVLPGIPDVMLFYRGVMFALEFKRPGEKPSSGQRDVMKKLHELGVKVAVVYSCEEAKNFLMDNTQESKRVQ